MTATSTTASLLRSKKPLGQFPEFAALREETSALAVASATHAKRGAKHGRDLSRVESTLAAETRELRAQMHALSSAFRSLSDVVVDELETLKLEVASQRSDVAAMQRQLAWTHAVEDDMSALRAFVERKIVDESAARERRIGECEAAATRTERDARRAAEDAAEVRAATTALRERVAEDAAESAAAHEAAFDAARESRARCDALERRTDAAEDALERISTSVARNAAETSAALRASAALAEARLGSGGGAARGDGGSSSSAGAIDRAPRTRGRWDVDDRATPAPAFPATPASAFEGLSPASRRFLERGD